MPSVSINYNFDITNHETFFSAVTLFDYNILLEYTGFWHEQSRADRDSHVKINTRNIIRGMEYNFLKYSLNKINHLEAPYDTCSVMHYGAYAFSKNRRPTIARISSSAKCELGQRYIILSYFQ